MADWLGMSGLPAVFCATKREHRERGAVVNRGSLAGTFARYPWTCSIRGNCSCNGSACEAFVRPRCVKFRQKRLVVCRLLVVRVLHCTCCLPWCFDADVYADKLPSRARRGGMYASLHVMLEFRWLVGSLDVSINMPVRTFSEALIQRHNIREHRYPT
jgi:hypothetical protein